MSRIVVLGGGVSGHTAATFLQKWLGKKGHHVTVITPNTNYNWIPSNVWVGVALMKPKQVIFPLKPVYERAGIEYVQARATVLHPEGEGEDPQPFVEAVYTAGEQAGQSTRVPYDYLINATGPKLNFAATPGLGPDGHSLSICTYDHAAETSKQFLEKVERMKRGERQTFVIGTGHGSCTCQGAAFEYIVNLEFELRQRKVRDKANIIWVSNEWELGDFGMGGMQVKMGGYVAPSSIFTESIFVERGIEWINRAHVSKVEDGRLYYETLDGKEATLDFDFAMLLPPFSGVGLSAVDAAGGDITAKLFAGNGFMKVDANYSPKPFEEWSAADWPKTLQNPDYPNHYAVGIAFAPPHAISRPRVSPKGTNITPAPPRTGMPSGMMGKAVAQSLRDIILGKADKPTHTASMSEMGAACVASAGANPFTGTAASMIVYPVVPDFDKYPQYGRDIEYTSGEIGLAGHWIKIILHHMFLHKAKLRPGWTLIPE